MTKEETINNIKAYLNGDIAIGNIIPLRFVLESAIKYLESPSIMKTKINKNMLYTFQANVFNERLGSPFGVTVNTTVLANNEQDAYEEAKKSFDKYIATLLKHHNIDAKGKIRKTINTFNYDNLKLV